LVGGAAARVEKVVAGAVAVRGEDFQAAASVDAAQREETVSASAVAFVRQREEEDEIP